MFKYLVFTVFFSAVFAGPHGMWKVNPYEGGKYYQGDMRLPLPKMTKNGLIDEQYRWPNGVVAYEINGDFTASQLQVIQDAFAEYDSKTGGCITFQERTTESNYVSIVNHVFDTGCWSYVGMIGNEQEMNLPDWCIDSFGSVLHEMLHALGFFHEQSRYDRDDYVIIMWDNIEEGQEHNFDKYGEDYITGFGYEYDYGSLMHYYSYAFSSNGERTIITLDPAYQDVIGQTVGFSDTDLGKLMAMYNC